MEHIIPTSGFHLEWGLKGSNVRNLTLVNNKPNKEVISD